jgi:hypothetical protein
MPWVRDEARWAAALSSWWGLHWSVVAHTLLMLAGLCCYCSALCLSGEPGPLGGAPAAITSDPPLQDKNSPLVSALYEAVVLTAGKSFRIV